MKTFNLNIFDGHAIISDGENIILIDTGSPSTIHTSNNLSFCSDDYNCSTNQLGLTVTKISEMLNTKITTLLGSDVLSNFQILFDYENKLVTFSKEEINFEGSEINISTFMGIPVIELEIGNQALKFFLDTGAKLSYLSNNVTQNYESIGTEEDFYPGVGKFETNCFEIATSLGEDDFIVKYGNLPTILQMTLMLGGTDGIIGFDFFNNFKVVFDFTNKRLKYTKQRR